MASLRPLAPLAFALLTLSGCADQAAAPASPRADRIPAARVTGAAQSCIPLNQFRETRVRDDRTIDFLAPTGRRGWRSTLPARCPGLTTEQAFSFNTSLSQLCGADLIRVLQRMGPDLVPGAACGLGPFVPIELEPRR